jgi:hypothetical protein
MEKNCTKCGLTKNVDDFPSCSECKDGYRNQCKDCVNGRMSLWRQENPDYNKEWVINNKDKDRERKKNHYELNKDKYIERSTDYRKNNKDRVNQVVRDYRKKRFNEDDVFKMTFNVRKRVREILKLKEDIKKETTFEIIGCTPKELFQHIENQFKDGMSWDNQGEWHIDHIIPLSSGKTISDVKKLCHYTNLQPLWAEDNRKKSNKLF